jgi:hypothetical protein
MTGAQRNALKGLRSDLQRLGRRLRAPHRRTGLLELEIAEHAVNEALEHSGLGGPIERAPDATAHRQARRWQKTVRDVRGQANALLRVRASEDLETALKALEIAEGSFEEVAERYE